MVNVMGGNEIENESERSRSLYIGAITVVRAVRKEMGVLFWTMP